MATKHTALPWLIDRGDRKDLVLYEDDVTGRTILKIVIQNTGLPRTPEEELANIEFVYRAVNNYEAVVELLERVRQYIECAVECSEGVYETKLLAEVDAALAASTKPIPEKGGE